MSKSELRVLIVSQMFPPEKGGNASRIGDLSKHMADELDVTVVSPPPCFPASDFDWSWVWETGETRDGVNVHRLWSWQLRDVDPSFIERMLYYFTFVAHAIFWLFWRREEFDVVVTTSPPIFTGIVALPFRLAGSVKWVVDIRDLWIDVSSDLGFISENGIITKISHSYQEFELRKADLITVTTEGTSEQLRERYNFKSDITTIPNGVDIEFFEPLNESTKHDLIYTGNLGYGQDLETCIRSMQFLDNSTTFQIVGSGDLKSRLENLADDLDLSEQIEFTGLVDREHIPKLLNQSKVGLAPLKDRDSLSYAIPTKVYEYMACELPIIALGRGQIETILESSGAGIVASNNPKQMAQQIERLLLSEQERKRIGKHGRQFVEEKYNRRNIAMELVQQIRTLCVG
ncbi:glycosyltransferase family 4 protein [Haladaptatus sp. GCM10025707]|uniref:glycosyltransferase family 4 protein n=1 Tax=unclassified Haladaptatus TaxID=2622732 RepID=UPI0023E7FB02|nr:glycosyltransferase family 4 protein [Haladaptatus sp. QDMS2]